MIQIQIDHDIRLHGILGTDFLKCLCVIVLAIFHCISSKTSKKSPTSFQREVCTLKESWKGSYLYKQTLLD